MTKCKKVVIVCRYNDNLFILNHHTMSKRYLGIAAAVVIIVIGVAVFRNQAQANTITIGAVYPLTGGLATYGEPAQKTAQLAVDEINAAGGVNGKQLAIAFEDHACDGIKAVAAFNKLHDTQGVRVFTAAACSGTISAMAPLLKDSVMLAPVTSATKLSGISPNYFRNWAKDGDEAKLFAAEIQKRGYKTIGVINEETDYAKGLRLALEADVKDMGVVVTGESFASDATDVRTQVSKIKALNPDVVFVSPQTVPNAEKVLKTMTDLGFKPKVLFVNDNIVKASALLAKYPALLEGAIGGDYVVKNSPAFDAVLAKYKAKYGADCPQKNICVAVYDSVKLLAQAVGEKGTDANALQSYLATVNYGGASGMISFDEKHDRRNADYSLFVVHGGASQLYQ